MHTNWSSWWIILLIFVRLLGLQSISFDINESLPASSWLVFAYSNFFYSFTFKTFQYYCFMCLLLLAMNRFYVYKRQKNYKMHFRNMEIKPWRQMQLEIFRTEISLFLLVAFKILFSVFCSFFTTCQSVVKINVFHQFRKTHSHSLSKYCSPSSFHLQFLLDVCWISHLSQFPFHISISLSLSYIRGNFFPSPSSPSLAVFNLLFFLLVMFLISMPNFLLLWIIVWFSFKFFFFL